MQVLISILNLFAGPLSGLVEKAVFAGVVYLLSRTGLGLDPTQLTAEIIAVLSALYTVVTKTQTAKIQSVNGAENGVKVVSFNSNAPTVNAPLPG